MFVKESADTGHLTHSPLAATFLCSYNTPSIIQDAGRLYPAKPEGHWRIK
jgi:hypothetical protein